MAAGWLGEYLRARRALVTPADAGLPATGRRRGPGLKRGEVAALAGISPEYYTRLEQGHDRHPSAQVLTAIARALRLDEPSTAHLLELAAPAPCGRRPPRPPGRVPPTLAPLLDTPPLRPARAAPRRGPPPASAGTGPADRGPAAGHPAAAPGLRTGPLPGRPRGQPAHDRAVRDVPAGHPHAAGGVHRPHGRRPFQRPGDPPQPRGLRPAGAGRPGRERSPAGRAGR